MAERDMATVSERAVASSNPVTDGIAFWMKRPPRDRGPVQREYTNNPKTVKTYSIPKTAMEG